MSRIYENCKEAIDEIERDIMEMGISIHPNTMQNKFVKNNPDFETKEVQNYTFSILTMNDKDEMVNDCLDWCEAEFQERVIPNVNPGAAYLLRLDVWEQFLNVSGAFDYTYSERLNYCDQINKVIEELKKNPDSRQCIIHVHQPEDIEQMQNTRIPCSIYYQLMIRNNKLDIIYNMRSSDFDTHFKNDIWLADELRDWIAAKIGVKKGIFHMNIGSLHRYKNYTTKHVF